MAFWNCTVKDIWSYNCHSWGDLSQKLKSSETMDFARDAFAGRWGHGCHKRCWPLQLCEWAHWVVTFKKRRSCLRCSIADWTGRQSGTGWDIDFWKLSPYCTSPELRLTCLGSSFCSSVHPFPLFNAMFTEHTNSSLRHISGLRNYILQKEQTWYV